MASKKRRNDIDPATIFLQAQGFLLAYKAIVEAKNPDHLRILLGHSAIVVSALSVELFLKCMICMETGRASRGHHLKQLFDQLAPTTRKLVCRAWDATVVPERKEMWADMEGIKTGLPHDLPTALLIASKSFEKVRYAYEDELEGVGYTLTDLPVVLREIILQQKPEWRRLRRVLEPWPIRRTEKD